MSDDPLHLIEQATFGGMVHVRASALIFLLGLVDGAMDGDADVEYLVQVLMPSTQEES